MGMNGRDLRKDNADDSDKDRKVSGNAVLSFQNAFRSACPAGLPAVAVISCDSTDFDQAIIMTTAIYFHPICQLHEMGAHHPESPARMKTMMNAFREMMSGPYSWNIVSRRNHRRDIQACSYSGYD